MIITGIPQEIFQAISPDFSSEISEDTPPRFPPEILYEVSFRDVFRFSFRGYTGTISVRITPDISTVIFPEIPSRNCRISLDSSMNT